MKNKLLIGLFILAGIAATLYFTVGNNLIFNNQNNGVKYMHAQWAFDGKDTPALVGWSDNVFIGKIIKENGSKVRDGIPITKYKVEVLENIKGNLDKTAIVAQEAGYKDGTLFVFENDTKIELGKTYMFATKYNPDEKWNLVAPIHGDVEIKSDTHKSELKEKFKSAHKNERKPF